MKQAGIAFSSLLVAAICCFGVLGNEGFDFYPHEVIRQARSIPVDINLASNTEVGSVTMTLPSSIPDAGPDQLLNEAEQLSQRANELMSVLQELAEHFSTSNGPEFESIQNMTTEVKEFSVQFESLMSKISEINATITNNTATVKYLEDQFTCMRKAECKIYDGTTTPPPPSDYNCTEAQIKTVTKDGTSDPWVISTLQNFDGCEFIIEADPKKGLWINVEITNFEGDEDTTMVVTGSGGELIGEVNSTTTRFPNIPDWQVIIKVSGLASFTINYTAVDYCKNYDCGTGGICSASPTNQPKCTCSSACFITNTTTGKCETYDVCQGGGHISCGDVPCVPTEDCSDWYCDCPEKPPTCKPHWCNDPSACNTKNIYSKSLWKRDEVPEDFDAIEFVQQAKEATNYLNITLPDDIEDNDPYALLDDANDLTAAATQLMSQLQQYLAIFNSTTSGAQYERYKALLNRFDKANETLSPLLDQLDDLQARYDEVSSSFDWIQDRLQCYAEKTICHPPPSTTTRTPAIPYDCTAATIGNVTNVGDSGSFSFTYARSFNNCTFKVRSAHRYGLWINLEFSNLIGDPYTIKVYDNRNGDDGNIHNVTGNGIIANLTSNEVRIVVTGDYLQFNLKYSAIDPCLGYDCGHGNCSAAEPDNMQKCTCSGCYLYDPQNRCTHPKEDPCLGNNACGDGKCVTNTDTCKYYCACPGVDPSCVTNQWCEGSDICYPLPKSSLSNWLPLPKWLKL